MPRLQTSAMGDHNLPEVAASLEMAVGLLCDKGSARHSTKSRLAIRCLGSVRELARQPENAVASASPASALTLLLHSPHWASTRNACSVSVWPSPRISQQDLPRPIPLVSLPGLPVLWLYDQNQETWPATTAAPSKLGRSADDRVVAPNALGIHLGLSRAVC